MYDWAVMWDWLSLAVRWVHVITGIAWIGSSFYFIALDLGLRSDKDLPSGASGEEWQVHGGGFYHIQKYLVAPDSMPDHLVWFKWESYTTWMSGFAMMAVVYYVGADLFLVDPNVWDVAPGIAILVSLVSLTLGWLLYDVLCKSKLGESPTVLMVLLYVILVVLAYGYTQIFSGRAAFIHLGAVTATIMSANVFLCIIPNQRIVVEDLKAGRTPDPKYGKIAKLRSTHNNYLTLPVLFLMLSNHYPLAFASHYNWIIASLVFIMGVTIRHYFNSIHARTGNPTWTWPVTAVLFIAAAWLSSLPGPVVEENTSLSPRLQQFAANPHFEEVRNVVAGRCSMCHAEEPFWDGIRWAPKGVKLETDRQVLVYAREIYLQAGRTRAMPPANVSHMADNERALIVEWYRSATAATN